MIGAEPVSFSVRVTGAGGPGGGTATVSTELRTTAPAMVAAASPIPVSQPIAPTPCRRCGGGAGNSRPRTSWAAMRARDSSMLVFPPA